MLTMKTYLVPIGIAISPRLLVSMILILAARPAEGQRELRKTRGNGAGTGTSRPPEQATRFAMQYVVAYAASAVVFLGLDLVWLGLIARSFYARQLGDLLRDSPSLSVAALFYALYVGGIVLFAISPALQSQSWRTALVLGLLLGLLAYGTYDLTNLATLRRWPIALSLVDMTWGSLLTGLAASAGYWAARLGSAGG
jgi:uncharacterized membrane protein